MTEKEAVRNIVAYAYMEAENIPFGTGKAFDIAIDAMKKQIPEKPVDKFTGNEWICECPGCGGQTDTPNEAIIKSIQYCG